VINICQKTYKSFAFTINSLLFSYNRKYRFQWLPFDNVRMILKTIQNSYKKSPCSLCAKTCLINEHITPFFVIQNTNYIFLQAQVQMAIETEYLIYIIPIELRYAYLINLNPFSMKLIVKSSKSEHIKN